MRTQRYQSGMSILGILTIAIMVGFFVTCGLMMAPSYFEYFSVKDVVTKTATEPGAGEKSIRQLRRRLDTLLNTNQVYGVDPKDIEIFRDKGKTYIDANYESRVGIVGRIDAVIRFDDLKFEVGKPAP